MRIDVDGPSYRQHVANTRAELRAANSTLLRPPGPMQPAHPWVTRLVAFGALRGQLADALGWGTGLRFGMDAPRCFGWAVDLTFLGAQVDTGLGTARYGPAMARL